MSERVRPLDGGVAVLSSQDAPAELRLKVYADRPGTATSRGESAEEQAAKDLLVYLQPRGLQSSTGRLDLPFGSRSITTYDHVGTCRVLEASLEATVPEAWRGPLLLALALRLSAQAIRDPEPADGRGPHLLRWGFAFAPPEGLCRRALVAHARTWRGALLAQHIALGVDVDALPASPVATEPWLVGRGSIAAHLNCSVRQVDRLIERGLPVYQVDDGCQVRALASEIDAWIRSCPWAGPARAP
jgi:hypothetical protein